VQKPAKTFTMTVVQALATIIKNELMKEIDDEKEKLSMYKTTIQFLIFEGQMLWTILSIFLISNTILIGFASQIIVKLDHGRIKPQFNIPCFIISIIGIFLCFPWLGTFIRNTKYYYFRMEQAKRLEPKEYELLNGIGEQFAEGNWVDINSKKMRIPCFAQFLTNKLSAYTMIFVFLLIYLLMLVFFGPWFPIPIQL
jgi:hypothetical protein